MISHIICNSVEGTRGYFEEEGKERQEDCFSHSSFYRLCTHFYHSRFSVPASGISIRSPAYYYWQLLTFWSIKQDTVVSICDWCQIGNMFTCVQHTNAIEFKIWGMIKLDGPKEATMLLSMCTSWPSEIANSPLGCWLCLLDLKK